MELCAARLRCAGDKCGTSAFAACIKWTGAACQIVDLFMNQVCDFMPRIQKIEEERIDPKTSEVFEQQIERWGARLAPYEIYARRPSILQAVLGMWQGLDGSGLLGKKLTTLVNRRVAALNGCVF